MAREDKISSYWFATDSEEQDRMISSHYALKSFFGGNVLQAVNTCVPFESGAKVLDIGCSSGAWVLDMSSEFPKSEFHGVDIAKFVRRGNLPSNVTFHEGDVLQRLDFPDNTFDFVHLRNFVFTFKVEDWPVAVREALRVTKVGGILQLLEMDMREVDCHEKMRQIYEMFSSVCQKHNQDPRIALQIEKILRTAGADILQVDERMVNFTTMPDIAKKRILWEVQRGLECMITIIGPRLQLEGAEAQKDLSEEILQCIADSNYDCSYKGVACQKSLRK
ncbi:hypothetical protein DFQ28_006005 [Apophysomyces sp. BC1034]|nr:hypothetical protein DFQ30_000102 [Apophysomyces sp. BC1015]KAG0193224.1 hypothetical protein DFQ28_006005 [Apophysomyces sp. BC1034]